MGEGPSSADALCVRDYRPEDLASIVDLFTGSVRLVAGRDYTEVQTRAWAPDQPDLAAWASRLERSRCWVAEVEGAAAGFCNLEPDGRLDMFYVHAGRQRGGVGRALLERLIAEANALGLARVFTEASITARPFFERFGFVVLAAQEVQLRGQSFVNYRMERVLTRPT